MKIIQINVSLSIGFYNASRNEVIDVYIEEGDTEEEIEKACEEAAKEWMYGYLDWGWSRVEA
jgi:hypothetical protein